MLMTMMTCRWISSVLLVQFVCRFDFVHHYNILHAEAFLLPSSLTRKSGKLTAHVHPYDSGRPDSRPLSEILEELVEQGISFPPTANREELELLIKSSRGNSSTDINNYEESKQRQRSPLPSTKKYASSASSSTGRTSHRQSRRPLYQTKTDGNSDDDDDNIHENYYYLTNGGPEYNDYSNINNNGSNRGVSDRRRDFRRNRRQRRQRRQNQLYNEDTDILGSIYQTSKRVVPKKVISIGNKATNIASRKTKKLWKNLVDSTFDEETESGVQKGRTRKPSVSPERAAAAAAAAAATTTAAESKRQRRQGQNYDGRRKEIAGSNYYDTPKRKATATTTTTTTTIPIQVILAELQAMGITFSPASSRQELEAMLSTAKQKQQPQQATKDPKFQDDKNYQRTNSNNKKKTKAVPSQKKSRGRSDYSSTNLSIVVDAVIEDFSKDESIQGNMNIDNVLIPPRKDIENWDARRQSSSTGSRVPSPRSDGNTAQRPRRRHEANFDDEDDIWNKNRSIPTTSDSTTISADESDRHQPRKTRIPSESPSTSFGSMKSRSKIIPSSHLSPSQRPAAAAAAAAAASFTGGDYTGQTTTSASTGRNEHSHKRRSRNPSKSEHRKIYSPRRRQPTQWGYSDDFDDEYRDGLDEFGDMLSNTVDSFLWGGREEDGEGSSSPTKRRRKRRKAINSKTGIPRSSGNWKDRMEEQLDRFMGIQEDGEYYNRWAVEDLEDEDNAGGTDAVSYAQGRAPKRNQRSTSKKRKKWVEAKRKEEAGGLLSFLFGTEDSTPRRRSRSYPDKKDRSLVRLLRSAMRSFRFFAGALAQWASVRGAIPEQVVIIGTCSAGLCSFPGRKVRNMIFTLLAMRIIGEVLQGYTSEDDPLFWREDDGDEDDENDPED